jgi:hypothetical protein
MAHYRPAAAGLALIMLAVVGCGSTKSTTSSNASGGARILQNDPRLAARVSSVCSHTLVKRNALQAKTTAELEIVVPELAVYQRAMSVELSKLIPSSSQSGDWQQFVAAANRMANASEVAARYAQANKFNLATPSMIQFNHARTTLRTIATRAGFTGCERF